MLYTEALQGLGRLGLVWAVFQQKRYNSVHKSVYGLSYDLYLLECVTNFISTYCSVLYRYSDLANVQFTNRYPLLYPSQGTGVPVSMALLVIDALLMIASAVVISQLWKYRATRNVEQGASLMLLGIFTSVVVFSYFTYACSLHNLPKSNSGRFGVFYIEHINYLWVIGNALSAFKYFPQLSLNWVGMSTKGFSPRYLKTSLISTIIIQVSNLFVSIDNLEFYEWPFNMTPRVVSALHLLALLLLFYQHNFAYAKNKPFLKRTYD
ncbi:hypothetical protein RNJ44_00015 [Nakaseomyces bracarensis]|uniref:Uncharacterized protein n=1 Tax=Nakaseomyces bracarensis TaxID=273131 RepID=A0ABR4P1G4_9SACH